MKRVKNKLSYMIVQLILPTVSIHSAYWLIRVDVILWHFDLAFENKLLILDL
jgi:hypothetical protein